MVKKVELTDVVGIPEGDFRDEQLEAIKERQAKEKLRIMEDLDKIPYPLMVTCIIDPKPFDYRNAAFWKQFEEKDRTVRELLNDYVNKREGK